MSRPLSEITDFTGRSALPLCINDTLTLHYPRTLVPFIRVRQTILAYGESGAAETNTTREPSSLIARLSCSYCSKTWPA